jgi:hypothetical protein
MHRVMASRYSAMTCIRSSSIRDSSMRKDQCSRLCGRSRQTRNRHVLIQKGHSNTQPPRADTKGTLIGGHVLIQKGHSNAQPQRAETNGTLIGASLSGQPRATAKATNTQKSGQRSCNTFTNSALRAATNSALRSVVTYSHLWVRDQAFDWYRPLREQNK